MHTGLVRVWKIPDKNGETKNSRVDHPSPKKREDKKVEGGWETGRAREYFLYKKQTKRINPRYKQSFFERFYTKGGTR